MQRFILYSKYTNLLRLVGMLCSILLMNHFLACTWWVVARDSYHAYQLAEGLAEGTVFDDYVHALFDAVLLMMGEKLDVYKTSERIVAFFVIIIMSVFVAVMFGEVALIVVSFQSSQSKYRR